jgi:nucleotide-binding universal stress UspA family protein
MVAVKKILVALDFSETSKSVLEFGRMLADACGASLHLLHIIRYPLAAPETVDREQRDGCSRLDALLDPIDRDSRHATTWCEVGTPAHEIVRYADENAIDLIVMGTHSHGPTFRMATGSIADSVVGSAPCAVLTVKAPGRGTGDRPSTRSRPRRALEWDHRREGRNDQYQANPLSD